MENKIKRQGPVNRPAKDKEGRVTIESEIYLEAFGVRGSVPVCEEACRIYGGNTSCYGVVFPDSVIIFDGGTGIRRLGRQFGSGRKEYHILISHLHLDHIQGLPFFAPFYEEGAQVTLYGLKKHGKGIREQLHYFLSSPLWPIGDESFACSLRYVDLEEGEETLMRSQEGRELERTIKGIAVKHNGGSAAYRLEFGEGESIVYALDYEPEAQEKEKLGKLSESAGLMIYDAQYFPEEYGGKTGWGHSTWEEALSFQKRYTVKKLVLGHHEPQHTDKVMEAEEQKLNAYGQNACFAKEGMRVYFGRN